MSTLIGCQQSRILDSGLFAESFFLCRILKRRVCSSVGQSTRLISVGSLVQIQPDPPVYFGGVAQLGERLLCKQEVIGSIPFTSTRISLREILTMEEESLVISLFPEFITKCAHLVMNSSSEEFIGCNAL
jgi:hypothetical protein